MWHRNRERVVWMIGPGTWVLLGCVVTSLGISPQVARAGHPPTPLPCAAEGVCLPNRTTWGWSQTRWRPWPGDKAGLQPTQTAAPTEDKPDEAFKPYERPRADEEDLRGRPQKKKDSKEPPADTEESTPDLPSLDLEGRVIPQQSPVSQQSQVMNEAVLSLPAARDVNLRQSANLTQADAETLRTLPSVTGYSEKPSETISTDKLQEDAPPSLPASLRQLTSGLQAMGRRTVYAKLAPRRTQAEPSKTPHHPTTDRGVVPATWQQSTGIQLINPVGAVSVAADGDELRQAIYYEVAQ